MQKETFQDSAAHGAYYKPTSSSIFNPDNLSDSFSLPNFINSTTTTTNQALGYIVQNNQDLVNRHNLCLIRLRDSLLENEQLRVENTTLRDINERLRSLLIKNYQMPPLQMNSLDVSGLMKGFGGISIGGGERSSQSERYNVDSPTSVLPENSDLVENDQRITLPKSISVRSNVYLKGQQGAGSSSTGGVTGGGTAQGRSSSRVRPASPLSGKQKVYVQGGKEEGEPVELEVYNQGMFKTELCNKWQETGACPYGNHCQFAHGIEELRPVIRHPRYKTEVCRMVLAGDSCPYGHRCHFRHALTDEEKLVMVRHS